MDEKEKQLYMKRAIALAKEGAEKYDEVPIGCVIVKDGKIVAESHNGKVSSGLATMHAEIIAIERATNALGDWRLTDCSMFVTLEPCAMCTGAIVNSRVGEVYFGAYDPKAGCCGSLYNLLTDKRFNHNPKVVEGGVEEKLCADMLSEYFLKKRNKD